MNKTNSLILILGILLTISCKKSSEKQLSAEDSWKLGWRVYESAMDDNLALGESQFDTLLSSSHKIDFKILNAGLEIKSKLNKHEEIKQILNSQDHEIRIELCNKDLLKDGIHCENQKQVAPENEILQLELVKMFINDQYARSNLMEDVLARYNLDKSDVIQDTFGVYTDERNRDRLKEIIKEFGFPTKALVGQDAMKGVFYIIQHSDGDKEWQKSQLANIEKAVKAGDMDGQSFAYLYDRIKVNAGEKQLYGTQFSNVDLAKKIVELAETENVERLDERRMEVGMMPIEMYKRFMLKFS